MSEEKKQLRLTLPPNGGSRAAAPRQKVAVTIPGQEYSQQQLAIIRESVMPPGSSDFEVAQFLTVCSTVKLDPFSRQIYAVRRKGRLVIQTGIDGYVTLAQRTGRYAGRSLPEWTPEPGKADRPDRCLVWVYDTRGGKAPGLALWSEHAPGNLNEKEAFMWRNRPFEQLEKCAFAKALRALFGAETFGGIYVEDEITSEAAPAFHVEHAPPEEAPRQVEATVLPSRDSRGDSRRDDPVTPPTEREAHRVEEWLTALAGVDSPDLLRQWQKIITNEVQSGAYGVEAVSSLRGALAEAQERLRGSR